MFETIDSGPETVTLVSDSETGLEKLFESALYDISGTISSVLLLYLSTKTFINLGDTLEMIS